MERIGDLPAHPLLVHFPVVMIPLLTIGAVWIAVRPSARQSLSGYLALLGIATFASTLLAASSGDALATIFSEGTDYADVIADHRGQGELLRFFSGIFAALLLGVWAMTRRGMGAEAGDGRRSVVLTVSALCVVAGLVSSAWVVRTGHSGATNSWGSVQLPDDGG